MKKLLLYSLFVMLSLCMTAQGTYTLTFNCEEQFGETVQPEVITVTNVTRNWTETLNYPENTLSLYWNGVDENYGSAGFLSEAYPNPFSGSTNVTFSGNVIQYDVPMTAQYVIYNSTIQPGEFNVWAGIAFLIVALIAIIVIVMRFLFKVE